MALTRTRDRMTAGAVVNCHDYRHLVSGSDWSPAINAALAKGGTVFLPAGSYDIASTLTVPAGTNFIMDGQARLTAVAAMYAMIQTSGEHQNGLITGGELRCNPTGLAGNNLAEVGLWLKHIGMMRVKDIEIWDNDQYGILIGDLTDPGNFAYEIFMENLQIRRSLIPMPVPSHGVYWAEGGDCHMSDSIIMGQDYGIGGEVWNTHFDRVHIWTPQENGIATVGFYLSGGGNTLVQCQVDGPTTKGIQLVGWDNFIVGYKYLMPVGYNGTDNQAHAIWVEAGRRASVMNSFMCGGNETLRLVAGIGGGDLGQITEIGNTTLFAVNPAIERLRCGARAFIRFQGSNPSDWAGMNIFSVTDNGVGDFTVNTHYRLPTVDFVVTATTDWDSGAQSIREISRIVGVGTQLRIEVLDQAGVKVDGGVQLVMHDLH